MKLHELRSAEADFSDIGADNVAVLPIGAVEQHGHHLPLGTDALIVDRIAQLVEARDPARVLLLPTLSVGASDHHLTMAGTVSVGTTVVARSAIEQCLALAQSSGIRRFLIVNGHGGNQPAERIALEGIRRSTERVLGYAVDYWELMFDQLDREEVARPTTMGHADLIETSILLATHPHLVRMDLAEPGAFDDALHRAVSTTLGIPERSGNGTVGDPRGATAEQGASFLEAAVRGVLRVVEQIASSRTR